MEIMQESEQLLQASLLRNMELEALIVRLQSENSGLESEKSRLEGIVLKMGDELTALRRMVFGQSSERYIKADPNQLSIDFGGEVQLEQEREYLRQQSTSGAPATSSPVKSHPVRKPLPDHLERREEIIEPLSLPEGSKYIGQEVTEILEFIPGRLYIRRIIRRKYALPGGEGVVIGELPSLPLPKSNAGASLLADLLVGKYQDHQPLHRQIEMLRRSGVSLSKSTVNNWVAGATTLLEPLYHHLCERVLGCDYIQVDESIIPVMDKDKPGATRKGYHWVVRSPEEGCLFFHYDRGSRAGRVVVELLKDFRGAVQSDGYGAYEVYEKKEGVLLLGCWAHARRKFEQALCNDPPRAQFAMEQIQKLYALERRMKDEDLPKEEIERLRKEEAYPILRAFEIWLDQNRSVVLPSSLIGKAIKYTYGIYPRLARYVLDGRYRIDNNLAENAVRPLALGRKNYLFCQNHEAAGRTAVIYSLLGTCKIWGVNPTLWLTDVLSRIQDHSAQRLDELLPDRWVPSELSATK
jgi:Transposase and inactivated derivatives